jgi:parvulin-like peptidyl-prolyl isomerase
MRQGTRMAGMLLVTATGLFGSGCFTGGIYQVPGFESLTTDLTAESTPRVTRSQQGDPANRPQLGAPIGAPTLTAPQLTAPQAPPPPPPTSGGAGVQQTSLTSAKNVRVSVRAWVNGKPIFEDEVMQTVTPSSMRDLSSLPEPRRSEKLSEIYNEALNGIIDQEVAYQDAVRRLESTNKKTLEKLKKHVDEKFEDQMKRVRERKKATEAQLKEVELLLRRQTERGIISREYMYSRIFPIANQQASAREIKEYYETHKNEFMRLDTVQWQDVFIAITPQRPTLAQCRRYAEELIRSCRTGDDFAKLSRFDDGDSKFRNGEGLGTHRGEIKPPEVENILFQLKEGQVGPVIELSTGVHIIRVAKREFAGLTPLDDKTQKLIENKIKNQVFEHEYKRIMRELRARATIEIERE